LMKHVKKIGVVVAILLLPLSLWYLLIKTNDFEVVIKAKTSPGTIYKNVLDWNKGLNKGTTSTNILKKTPFKNIVHSYHFESYNLEMDWHIHRVNDSISSVSIGINDLDNSLKTRVHKLLGTSPLEKLIAQEFSGFNTVLVNHIAQFRVAIDGQEESPEAYVAYVNIACHQDKKADNMIMNSTYINSFLQENGLKVVSNPFLEVVDWNIPTGQVNFNFCFPIEQGKNLPKHEEIQYKKVAAKKALKATFHGNYSYTDEAWFALYQYSQDHQIKRLNTITEIFYENPHTAGIKDIEWEAGIYMEVE